MSKNKKYYHFYTSVFCSGFIFFLATTSIFADDIYSTATIEILARDSIMQKIIIEVADVDNLNKIDKILLKWLKAYPEFEYIIRINSKGKIISKVTKNKILPRDFRYIGNQKWYNAIELLEKPYYGNMIQNKGIFLFWNRPVLMKSRKKTKFAGVLSIKIDLKKCFRSISQKNNLNFDIVYANQTIFTNLNKTNPENIITRKLSIYGLPDLFIRYEKAVPVSTVSKKESKPREPHVVVSLPVLHKVHAEKIPEKIKPVNSMVDKILHKKSNPVNWHIFLYAIAICLALFGLCIFFINRAVLNLTSRKIH